MCIHLLFSRLHLLLNRSRCRRCEAHSGVNSHPQFSDDDGQQRPVANISLLIWHEAFFESTTLH